MPLNRTRLIRRRYFKSFHLPRKAKMAKRLISFQHVVNNIFRVQSRARQFHMKYMCWLGGHFPFDKTIKTSAAARKKYISEESYFKLARDYAEATAALEYTQFLAAHWSDRIAGLQKIRETVHRKKYWEGSEDLIEKLEEMHF